MKLKIQTLTRETFEVEVDHESATIKTLKREIYRAGKFTAAVRIVKGQDILPDDSTLAQYNITDGTTVNIVIEPDKEINIKVVFGPRSFEHLVKNSISVQNLKQLLESNNEVVFCDEDFGLNFVSDGELRLEDEVQPLHYYGIGDQAKLRVVKNFVIVKVIPENAGTSVQYKKVSHGTSIEQLKGLIMGQLGDFDISLFILNNAQRYEKVDAEKKLDRSIGEVCGYSESCTLYMLDNKFRSGCRPVYYKGEEIGSICVDRYYERPLNVKLRVQHELGIPAGLVGVTKGDPKQYQGIESYAVHLYNIHYKE